MGLEVNITVNVKLTEDNNTLKFIIGNKTFYRSIDDILERL